MNAAEIADEWAALAGHACTCPPDCTDTHWGNGPRTCNPACQPCRLMAGRTYHQPPKGKPA